MSAPTKAPSAHKKERKTGLTPVKVYLLAFNLLSAALWARLLVITVWFIVTPRAGVNYAAVPTTVGGAVQLLSDHLSGSYDFHQLGYHTKYTQSLAVLEVVHAALGLVRSPVGTVASQVASRLWAVWGVVELVPETHTNPLFTTMLLAWSITETIRYPFYFFALLNKAIYAIDFLRYNTFLVLYPLGAGSEAFLSFSTVPPLASLPYVPRFINAFHDIVHRLPVSVAQKILHTAPGRSFLVAIARARAAAESGGYIWTPIQLVRLALFFVWWPALFELYTYMLGQRRKFFRKQKGKTVAGVNKSR